MLGAQTTGHGSCACGAGGAAPSGATRESECARVRCGGIDSPNIVRSEGTFPAAFASRLVTDVSVADKGSVLD